MDSQVFIAIVVFALLVVVPAIIEHMKNQKKREQAERQRRLRQAEQTREQDKPAYRAGGDEIKQYLQSIGVKPKDDRTQPERRPAQPAPAPQPAAPPAPQPRQAPQDVPVLEEVRSTAESVFQDATDTLRHYLDSIGIPTPKPQPQPKPRPAPSQARPRPQPKPRRVPTKAPPQPKPEPQPAPPSPEPPARPQAAPQVAATVQARRRHPLAAKPSLPELRRAFVLREVLTRQNFKRLPYERDLL